MSDSSQHPQRDQDSGGRDPSPGMDASSPHESFTLDDELDQLFAHWLKQQDQRTPPGDEERNLDRERLTQLAAAAGLELSQAELAQLFDQLRELLETSSLVETMAGPTQLETTSEFGAPGSPGGQTQAFTAGKANLDDAATATHRLGPFGNYDLQEVLGQGGMGVVYRAFDRKLGRTVALKMIRSGVLARADDLRRFQSEAKSTARLQHPAIVQLFHVNEVDGQHFFTMELIEGEDLSKLIARESLGQEEAARYVRTVAEAIDHAHQCGIIHRDLKPANIIRTTQNEIKVTDFGLAKNLHADTELTATGVSVGTPAYMAPEQALGKDDSLGPQTDVYSLGAILFELLTGQRPFQGETCVDMILDVVHRDPPRPRTLNPQLDPRLEAICLKCLNKVPQARYESARELAADLDRFLADESVTARHEGPLSRSWNWLRNVPIIAALTRKRIAHPTLAHHLTQWVLIFSVLAAVAGWAWYFSTQDTERMPAQVKIATGLPKGLYLRFGRSLAQELEAAGFSAEAIPTEGSVENKRRLLSREVDVALLQSSAIDSDELAVVCPLYNDFVFVAVKRDRGIQSTGDLNGKTIVIGPPHSGMQLSSRHFISHLELEVQAVEGDFSKLPDQPSWDAAIVTTGTGNDALRELLSQPEVQLLTLRSEEIGRLLGPVFQAGVLPPGSLEVQRADGELVPQETVTTLTTTTFLVVRQSAAGPFVHQLLQTVYEESDLPKTFKLMSLAKIREWSVLPYHHTAREYFLNP